MLPQTERTSKLCSKSERMEESFSSGLRNWEDMNLDILQKIFRDVPSSDLSRNVTTVCQSWQLGCWQVLCWTRKTFNLGVIKAPLQNLNLSIMKLLKSIFEYQGELGIYLEHWGSSVETILIPADMEISDDHLLYIAERTTGLKSLALSESSKITVSSLMKAMCNWKNFQFIHLQQVNYRYFSQIVDEIIRNGYALDTVCLRMNDLPSGKDARTLIMINMILDIMKYGSGFEQIKGFISASFYNFNSKVFEPSPDYADLYNSYPFNITLKLKGEEGDKKGSNEDDDKAVSDSVFLDDKTRPQRGGPVLVCVFF